MLYALTGLVLAWLLSPTDFGLVGAVLIFQAFAWLLIDSGFSFALIQRKNPTRLDYSSVLWFNLAVASILYIILYICAPLIADCFDGDRRLVPLSRVMFITIVTNASAIVQSNRLIKQMNPRPLAMANLAALVAGAIVGIWMAFAGYGPWAIVWQSIAISAVKSAILWATGRWLPLMRFSWPALRSFFSVGGSMMLTAFLNTLFQNIYSFVIGNRIGLAPLGYFTQANKWSKMAVVSISMTLTSSLLPALSQVQDDEERFKRLSLRMARLTAYISAPVLIGLIVMATPTFHIMFGDKWDASIILFQLLLFRGMFTVMTDLYNNFIIALGRSRLIVKMEIVRDATALIALAATLPFMSAESASHPLLGVEILLYGQIAAGAAAYIITLVSAARTASIPVAKLFGAGMPYFILSALIAAAISPMLFLDWHPWAILAAMSITALSAYLLINKMAGSRIQADALAYILHRR